MGLHRQGAGVQARWRPVFREEAVQGLARDVALVDLALTAEVTAIVLAAVPVESKTSIATAARFSA